MVGPVSDAERAAFTRKVRIGVVVLVGVSAGLTALRVGASLLLTGGAFLAGAAVGWVLAWFVVPEGVGAGVGRERQQENPFEDTDTDETDATQRD